MAEEQAEAAAFARGEREPARHRQIGGGIVMEFGDDGGERAALERLLHRPERITGTRDARDDQLPHRQAEKIETRAIEIAALAAGKVGLDPERWPASRTGQRRHRQRKTASCAEIERPAGMEFVQSAAAKPATEHGIERRHADSESGPVSAVRSPCVRRFDRGDAAPQMMQPAMTRIVRMRFVHVGSRHGHPSKMFAICSYRFRAAGRMSSKSVSY